MTELEQCMQELREKWQDVHILSKLPSGKEATVYLIEYSDQLYALKVYTTPENRTFRHMKSYIAGKYYKNKSDQKAIDKWNTYGKKKAHTNWIAREYTLLQRAHEAGIPVPQVYMKLANGIVMEYIGTRTEPAPKLSDLICTQEQRQIFGSTLLGYIEHLWSIGIVHGDLSPFNILYFHSTLILIDFPQAIDVRTHPHAEMYYERDRTTISTWMDKKS